MQPVQLQSNALTTELHCTLNTDKASVLTSVQLCSIPNQSLKFCVLGNNAVYDIAHVLLHFIVPDVVHGSDQSCVVAVAVATVASIVLRVDLLPHLES